jgi:hypothetical protein
MVLAVAVAVVLFSFLVVEKMYLFNVYPLYEQKGRQDRSFLLQHMFATTQYRMYHLSGNHIKY